MKKTILIILYVSLSGCTLKSNLTRTENELYRAESQLREIKDESLRKNHDIKVISADRDYLEMQAKEYKRKYEEIATQPKIICNENGTMCIGN